MYTGLTCLKMSYTYKFFGMMKHSRVALMHGIVLTLSMRRYDNLKKRARCKDIKDLADVNCMYRAGQSSSSFGYLCMYVCICVRMCVHMYVCMYVCSYVCMYLHACCMHTCI